MSLTFIPLYLLVIQTLPMLHMAKREWFDDDEFIEDDGAMEDFDDNALNGNTPKAVSNFMDSIQNSVESMKLSELQASLKKKGLKSSGSKSVLRDRLLRSLLEESGFGS